MTEIVFDALFEKLQQVDNFLKDVFSDKPPKAFQAKWLEEFMKKIPGALIHGGFRKVDFLTNPSKNFWKSLENV